jgi:hypothetical protein
MTGDLLMTKRRKFSREFKLAAVKKIVEKGLSPAEVSLHRRKSPALANNRTVSRSPSIASCLLQILAIFDP